MQKVQENRLMVCKMSFSSHDMKNAEIVCEVSAFKIHRARHFIGKVIVY